MGNSVKLCLLFATHLVARARTHQTKIMIFDKAFISYLVIMSTCSGLPVNQEEAEEVVVKDEAIFEALRDHDLQLSMNGGQSGGWFRLFGESEETTSRPKRQDDAMADDLVVPPVVLPVTVAPTTTEAPAPIDDAYAQRLKGSAIALALKLANAKPQKVVRSGGYGGRKKRQAFLTRARPVTKAPQKIVRTPGYGRKKRQAFLASARPISTNPATLTSAIVQPVTVAPTTEAPAPILPPRLQGSAIALALELSDAKPQEIVRSGGYGGRKKRQISDEEEEAILQEISEIESSLLPESTVIQVILPQVTSWGETGIVLPVKSSA